MGVFGDKQLLSHLTIFIRGISVLYFAFDIDRILVLTMVGLWFYVHTRQELRNDLFARSITMTE